MSHGRECAGILLFSCVLTCKRRRRLLGKSASFQHKCDTFGVASSKNSLLRYFPFVPYGYHIGQVYSWAGCQHHPRERLTQMLSSSPNWPSFWMIYSSSPQVGPNHLTLGNHSLLPSRRKHTHNTTWKENYQPPINKASSIFYPTNLLEHGVTNDSMLSPFRWKWGNRQVGIMHTAHSLLFIFLDSDGWNLM